MYMCGIVPLRQVHAHHCATFVSTLNSVTIPYVMISYSHYHELQGIIVIKYKDSQDFPESPEAGQHVGGTSFPVPGSR